MIIVAPQRPETTEAPIARRWLRLSKRQTAVFEFEISNGAKMKKKSNYCPTLTGLSADNSPEEVSRAVLRQTGLGDINPKLFTRFWKAEGDERFFWPI